MKSSERKQPNRWLSFATFNDEKLLNLERQVYSWFEAFSKKEPPRWLTICGRSEMGKTYCADQIWRRAKILGLADSLESEFTSEKIWWPAYVNQLRMGRYDHLLDTRHWPLLYLDDVGASRDSTGWVADQLYGILGFRDRKWTILTTNLTMDQLGAIDERIVSRCVRNGGVVVEVNTVPFTSRSV